MTQFYGGNKMAKSKKFKGILPTPEVTPEAVEESFVEEVSKVEEQLPVEEPKQEEKVEEPVEDEVVAVVDGVKMNLNIRSNPKVEPNNQIAVIGKGTKLIVMSPNKPIKKNGETWYKVRLKKDDPTIGYAMKKYIKLI